MGPESRKPAQASTRASDQTNRKHQLENGRSFDAAQPCLFRVRRNAFNAAVTIAPMVRPLLLAYFRSNSIVRGGSFKGTDTVASGISTGRSSWEPSPKERYAWRSDKPHSRDRRRTASGSAPPRCSRPRAAFMWRAFCALFERAIRHRYITVYDEGQAVRTFLATL